MTNAIAKRGGQPGEAVLAARLREARGLDATAVEEPLSQRDLVKRLPTYGITFSPSQMAKVETCKREVSVPELLAFADALKTSIAFLLTPQEGEGLRVGDKVLSPEEAWAWHTGETTLLVPEHIDRRRRLIAAVRRGEEAREILTQEGVEL
jgi:transcriptional regulator with XRE-family HTH domain